MKKMKVTPVEEVNYGLYLWQTADGGLVCDDDGNYLSIPSIKGDIRQIKKIKDAANYYGVGEGKPVFFSGHRQVTEEEYQNQKQRLDWGLVADEYDLPALKEDLVQKKKMGII